MDPPSPETLPSNQSKLLDEILNFLKRIRVFKYTKYLQNPQFIRLFQKNLITSKQIATLWQVLLETIRAYSKNPIDFGREITEVLILICFGSYFAPKQQRIIMFSLHTIEQQRTILRAKQKRLLFTRSSNPDLYQDFLKALKKSYFPSIYGWYTKSADEFMHAKVPPIDQGEVKSLKQQIQGAKDILTLEFITNVLTFFSSLNKNCKFWTIDKNLNVKLMVKHAVLEPTSISKNDRKIWLSLKRKLIRDPLFTPDTKKYETKRLMDAVFGSIASVTSKFETIENKSFYHEIHKCAQKQKKHFLADMIRSKCFNCQCQRFSSSSIHKTRIYQCLSRKFLNIFSQFQRGHGSILEESDNLENSYGFEDQN